MTTDHTDAAVRILTKTIRKLTAKLAEADRMASVRTSMLADTMTELEEEREARAATERRWIEQSERVVSLESDLAKRMTELDEERKASHSTALSVAAGLNERLQDRIDRALEWLDADTPLTRAKLRQILTGN